MGTGIRRSIVRNGIGDGNFIVGTGGIERNVTAIRQEKTANSVFLARETKRD